MRSGSPAATSDQIDSGSCASSSSGRRCLGRGRADQVLELTHVAQQWHTVKRGKELVARPRWRHAGWTMPRDHVGDQRRDVAAALADRRHVQ